MKRIACLAILALLFTSCKENNSEKEVKATKETVNTNSTVKKETEEKKEDCKDIEVEMGAGRECILKGTDLAQVYQNIIKNKEVEESVYFLNTIPNESKSVPVNKNGLISIDYDISKDKVLISMNYEGGVTEVTLEKIKDTIKKSIYHYAD
ncbi:hypothetical protein [Flavobacterium collinsii]|uniref:Lipoprotein n=1 Tax=Flavobacterium collinsii TaxID=1114861 RepID=A0ABM8KM89_9FLAO|nr:hypothetical protein [Flavobacterium collinsii]CAA9201051.1 hypothetical protein FLACOL7796_03585 [Flavobacterium collinsii]